jgi:hypothetical protein
VDDDRRVALVPATEDGIGRVYVPENPAVTSTRDDEWVRKPDGWESLPLSSFAPPTAFTPRLAPSLSHALLKRAVQRRGSSREHRPRRVVRSGSRSGKDPPQPGDDDPPEVGAALLGGVA